MRIDVLGTEFDSTTLPQAVEESLELIEAGGRGYVVTPNPEIVMLCRENAALTSAVKDAFLVLPDGIGVIIGAKLLKRPLLSRIAGIEYGEALLAECARLGFTAYLLGAKPGVAEAAADNLCARYPRLVIVGTHDGYFKDSAPVIDEINAASPDVLLVCLGAPAQELWMAENIGKLNVRIAVGLGGAFDVFSGRVQRAPKLWRRLGLEWLYRLLKEPRRFRRMLKLPEFLMLVILRRLFHGGR